MSVIFLILIFNSLEMLYFTKKILQIYMVFLNVAVSLGLFGCVCFLFVFFFKGMF